MKELPEEVRQRGRRVADLLRGAWRPSPGPASLSARELEAMTPLLLRNGSGGLAWHRLKDSSLRDHPGALRLRDAYRLQTLRVRELEAVLSGVGSRLRAHGVEGALAKGWGVGRLYPAPGLRPYGDLDLLVRPGELDRVRQILEREEPGALAHLELHTDFDTLEDRSTEELLEARIEAPLQGTEIPLLAPEDHLRLLCLHGLKHGLCRPLWLCDLGAFMDTLPDGFDWGRAMTGDAWASRGVRGALAVAGALLGVSLAGVPAAWRREEPPDWMLEATLEAFGARTHYMEGLHPGDLLLEPRSLVRGAGLRWSNPLEVAYRRRLPWGRRPGTLARTLDYALRGAGFVLRLPLHLPALLVSRRAAQRKGKEGEDGWREVSRRISPREPGA